MIGKFWDSLGRYADKAKRDKDEQKYAIVQEIESMLQTTYDFGIASQTVVEGYEGKDELENLVLSIPDIIVYKDPQDGQIMYELDDGTKRFDTPQEVIKYLIRFRNNKINRRFGRME